LRFPACCACACGFRPYAWHVWRSNDDAQRAATRAGHYRKVLRTGRIPGRNVTQLEFCDLVCTAAQIRATAEGFPRGWSKASIMNHPGDFASGPNGVCRLHPQMARVVVAEVDRELGPLSSPASAPRRVVREMVAAL
jgi:hypothetical protein